MGLACKDCQKRYPGCHDKCEEYKKSKEEHKKKQAFLQEAKNIESEWMRYVRSNQ